MYMIAGLCMLKLYQARHPDINASAYSAYASFAAVITLTVLGVVGPSLSASVWLWRSVRFGQWGGFCCLCLFVGLRVCGFGSLHGTLAGLLAEGF